MNLLIHHAMIMKYRPMQRFTFVYSMGLALLTALGLGGSSVMAQTPAAWENLTEQLVAVELSPGVRQEGVLSLRTGTQSPDLLAVLLPGYPSVLRPVVADQRMTSLRLPGLHRAWFHWQRARGDATHRPNFKNRPGQQCRCALTRS
jgi:hypothetical protein